ncbi:MAG TPA: hypothetical protein V6C89_08270 [Drouetiella sp.]
MSELPSRYIKDGVECEEVQSARRLSESLLWTLQEEYYANKSLKAWERVPFYSTSRMMFVGAIAELVSKFLLDLGQDLNFAEPVYILELGGGSGCFAYRFINQLKELLADFEQFKSLRFQYILSDFAKANVDAHLRNLRIRPLIDSGELEVAVYDPQISNTVKLEVSGQTLCRGKLKNPLLIIANYFFDTIKQDAFRIIDGVLKETQIALYREMSGGESSPELDEGSSPELDGGSSPEPEGESSPRVSIQEIKMSETYADIGLPYYNDPYLDSILAFYQNNLADSSVIFPIGAMRSLANLSDLADGKLAAFVSDKGFASLDSKQVLGLRTQEFAEHGAFSFDVNFDSIKRYVENKGGAALIESGDHSSLGFIFATTWPAKAELAKQFFRQSLQKRDVCNASYNLEEFTFVGCEHGRNFVRPYLTNFVSIVQSSNFDPFIFDGAFARLFEGLVPELTEMDSEQEREVTELLRETFNNIFNVANDYCDLAAILEFCMCWHKYEFCLELALEANSTLGPSRKAFDYAAIACEHLERGPEAYEYFRQSVELKPDHDWAREGMERNRAHCNKSVP